MLQAQLGGRNLDVLETAIEIESLEGSYCGYGCFLFSIIGYMSCSIQTMPIYVDFISYRIFNEASFPAIDSEGRRTRIEFVHRFKTQ